MERAGRLLGQLKVPRGCLSPEDMARTAWPNAVGKRIAQHCGQVRLVRTKLVVEVEDAIWQRQLFGLRNQILDNLQKTIGPEAVTELEFRVALPRHGPQIAAALHAESTDESDGIRDPILRQLYRDSRKKASA